MSHETRVFAVLCLVPWVSFLLWFTWVFRPKGLFGQKNSFFGSSRSNPPPFQEPRP